MHNRSRKYEQALKVATAQGWRFAQEHPRSNILYYALLMSGFRWLAQAQEWQRWHQPYVVLERESA